MTKNMKKGYFKKNLKFKIYYLIRLNMITGGGQGLDYVIKIFSATEQKCKGLTMK